MRILPLLAAALLGTSCVVPPSCIDRVFGLPGTSPNTEHFATLTVYGGPIEGPVERSHAASPRMSERFERGASITVNARGRMAVSSLDLWPERCPKIPQEDLAEVSRSWQPLLEPMSSSHMDLQVMANPYTSHGDWRPDGPILELSFGSTSGKSLGLLWDGRSSLPGDLDTAVMGTLEMVCSNSRLAKKYLFRDLPRQVTSRLDCP
jgi:hypothetical protein